MNENRINATISEDDKNEVKKAITSIRNKLPFLIDLPNDEKNSLPKFGDRSLAFIRQAYDLSRQNDNFLPRSFDVEEMGRDVRLLEDLNEIRTVLSPLVELIEDTYFLVGSEAYIAALDVYQAAKRNGEGEALDSLVDSLGRRFERRHREKKAPAPQAPQT